MLILSLGLGTEADSDLLMLDVVLHADYGEDPATANLILQAALTAEAPVVVDEQGCMLWLPPDSVRRFGVRHVQSR